MGSYVSETGPWADTPAPDAGLGVVSGDGPTGALADERTAKGEWKERAGARAMLNGFADLVMTARNIVSVAGDEYRLVGERRRGDDEETFTGRRWGTLYPWNFVGKYWGRCCWESGGKRRLA